MPKASIETPATEGEIIATFDKHLGVIYGLSVPVNGNTGALSKSDSSLDLFYYLVNNGHEGDRIKKL